MDQITYRQKNGWSIGVSVRAKKLHSIRVLNPEGKAIHLLGPRRTVLAALTEGQVTDYMLRVKKLSKTTSDEEAVKKIMNR